MTAIYNEHLTYFKNFYTFKPIPFKLLNLQSQPIFNNVAANRQEISNYLLDLGKCSAIYVFFLTEKPLHFFIGKAEDIYSIFNAHFNQTLKEDVKVRHAKLNSYVQMYKWDSFSFTILEVCSSEDLDNRENYYLDQILANKFLLENTLNNLSSKGLKRENSQRRSLDKKYPLLKKV